MAKTIGDYKKDYEAAKSRGDAAGMKAANDGANAIRQSMGQASQVASQDIANVASGNRGGGSSSAGGSGGGSGGLYNTTLTPVSSTNGSGGSSGLIGSGVGGSSYQEKLASASRMYNDAKAKGDWHGMLQANTWANQLRNEQGQAATWAYDDINSVRAQNQTVGDRFGYGGGGGYPQGQQQNQQDNLYAQYLEELQRQYAEIQAQQEAAKRAAVEQAVGQLSGQKTGLEQNYQDLYRQLYLQRRNAEKNLPQQMAAMGYNGGLTESSALNLQTSYADALRQGEQAKQGTLSEIDRAIADARLSGDISIAEQAAQLAQDRLASYGSTVDAMQQQNNWAAQFGYNQYVNDRDFNYQAGRDQTADSQWQQSFSRQQLLDEFNRADTTYERKVQAAQYLYETTGDSSLLAVLGYTPEQIAALKGSYAAAMAGSSGSGGGRSGGSGNSGGMTLTTAKQAASAGVFSDDVLSVLKQNGYSDEMLRAIYGYAPSGGPEGDGGTAAGGGEWDGIDTASVTALGYGPISRAYLEQLVDQGAVKAYQDPASGLIRFRRVTQSGAGQTGISGLYGGMM